MNTASRSSSPTERSIWRCVPSPQSNSRRSPPRRTSTAGSPRRALGADPAVPRKNSDRSMLATVAARGRRGSGSAPEQRPGIAAPERVGELPLAACDRPHEAQVRRHRLLLQPHGLEGFKVEVEVVERLCPFRAETTEPFVPLVRTSIGQIRSSVPFEAGREEPVQLRLAVDEAVVATFRFRVERAHDVHVLLRQRLLLQARCEGLLAKAFALCDANLKPAKKMECLKALVSGANRVATGSSAASAVPTRPPVRRRPNRIGLWRP